MVKTMAGKAKRAKKRIEEAVQYALGHRTRVQILILLNEGIFTAGELAQMIGEPLNNVHTHLGRMLEDGSIEIAKEKRKGNMTQYWYKAVEPPAYTVAEFEQLPYPYRQNIAGAFVQSGFAEVLAGLYAGKLADPRATIFWDWYHLDAEGRKAADELTERFIEEMQEIECEAANRVAETEEETASMVLNTVFFERPRRGGRRHHRSDTSAIAE